MLEIFAFIKVHTEVLHIANNLKCSAPKEIPLIFHNGSNQHFNFIIKELAEKKLIPLSTCQL